MNYLEFFTTDNKSGWKTREDILKNKEPKIYDEIKTFIINNNNLNELSFKQQVWHFIHNDKEIKKCLNCGVEVSFKDSLSKGYRSFCSMKCTNESDITQKRAVEKNREKYGVDYFPQHESHMIKVKETKLERYGDENYNNIEQTLLTKELLYGDKYYSNKNKGTITNRVIFIDKLKTKTKDKLIKYDTLNNDSINHMFFNCFSCKQDYSIYLNLFNYRISVNVKPCTICNPIKDTNSIQEKELFEYIKSLLPNEEVINKDRTIISNIKPLELDINIPSHKLAIEFNGLYWHSSKYENKNHLLIKTKKCLEKYINLIHIFEDEWIYKQEIVKSIISGKLSIKSNKIYGRKCIIKEVSPKDSKLFLETNHLQGNVNSKIKLGLYYDNELVGLMTFGGLRKSMGSKSEENHYEMYRFCTKLNVNIIGGFSKLLKHFISNYKPLSITSFSDNRYFSGNVYKNNNFKFIRETEPNYFYIINHKREGRFKYRKDILVKQGFDSNKTELQIMEERGINRIYDCGNKKWLLEF